MDFTTCFCLLASAPWQLRSDSQILVGMLIGTVGLLALLFLIGKVPLIYNFSNLTARWVTSIMTALAFTLVIGLLMIMLGFVNGMYILTENSGQPGNVILMAEGSTDETFSSLGVTDIGDIENQVGITRTAEGVPMASRETYIIVNQPIADPLPGKPKRRFLSLRGVDDPAMSGLVHDMKLHSGGNWFGDAGVRSVLGNPDAQPEIEVVIGAGIAKQMAADLPPALRPKSKAGEEPALGVGDSFELNNRTWRIVGVMHSDGSTFESEVWAKRSLVGPMFGKNSYSTLVLRAEPMFRADQRDVVLAARKKRAKTNFERAKAVYDKRVEAENAAVKANPGRKKSLPTPPEEEEIIAPKSDPAWGAEVLKEYFNNDYEKSKVNAIVETTYFKNLSSTNAQFLVAIEFVAVVLAIGGVFGVMNTMFAAVSQRARDIGVLRLLGFYRWQILVSFLLESLLIAIVGSMLGCAIGLLWDGVTVSSIVSSGQGGGGKAVVLKMVVDISTLAMGMFLGIVMGLLGGLIPSLGAMRMTSLESLR